jgi:hypothetical protein
VHQCRATYDRKGASAATAMVTCTNIPDATSIVYEGIFDIHDAGAEVPERGDNGD